MEAREKLNEYIKRNTWLFKKYFTPKSLATISLYFQQSRIVYGMSSYLDMKKIIDKVESWTIFFAKSVLGLHNQVNSNRVRLALCRPKVCHNLWALLRRNIRKYKDHFKEDIWIYNIIDYNYEQWFKKGGSLLYKCDIPKLEYRDFKRLVAEKSRTAMAAELKVNLGADFAEVYKKYYFKWPDKRDIHLLKYIVNGGFYKSQWHDKCLCGEDNSRTHVTNTCTIYEQLRNSTTEKLGKVLNRRIDAKNLEEAILSEYFRSTGSEVKKIPDILDCMKNFAICLIITWCEAREGRKSN
jgi:hypothetical protein